MTGLFNVWSERQDLNLLSTHNNKLLYIKNIDFKGFDILMCNIMQYQILNLCQFLCQMYSSESESERFRVQLPPSPPNISNKTKPLTRGAFFMTCF